MLIGGTRLDKPESAPAEVWNTMIPRCWNADPTIRPTFLQLKKHIRNYWCNFGAVGNGDGDGSAENKHDCSGTACAECKAYAMKVKYPQLEFVEQQMKKQYHDIIRSNLKVKNRYTTVDPVRTAALNEVRTACNKRLTLQQEQDDLLSHGTGKSCVPTTSG